MFVCMFVADFLQAATVFVQTESTSLRRGSTNFAACYEDGYVVYWRIQYFIQNALKIIFVVIFDKCFSHTLVAFVAVTVMNDSNCLCSAIRYIYRMYVFYVLI